MYVNWKVVHFPVTKKIRPVSCILATKECFVYCYCKMTDSGELICCNQCSDWFHEVCITDPIPSDIEQWKYASKNVFLPLKQFNNSDQTCIHALKFLVFVSHNAYPVKNFV